MPNYPSIDGRTLSEVVTAAGANSQVQGWVAQAVVRGIRKSPWSSIIGGALSGRPILKVLAAEKLKGQTVHLEVEAPMGGPLVQGSGATRTGSGEEKKFTTFDFSVGIGWKGSKWNNYASYASLLGTPEANKTRDKLSDWHSRYQGDCVEAMMIANAHSQNTVYANRKASREALRSADTFTANDVERTKFALLTLGAKPFNVAKRPNESIQNRYWAQLNNYMVQDMKASGDWQQLLADSRARGTTNELYTGDLPDWQGNVMNVWEVSNDDADGPQGAFCAPIAFLGEEIAALPTTATGTAAGGITIKGGRNAAGAALTTPKYFHYFPAAEFQGYHDTAIIAATTGTDCYALIKYASGADAGKFTMVKYRVNDGNRITMISILRSTNATSGKIDATTVGNVTWNTGAWTTDYLSDLAVPVGSMIIPCNSYGQPFVRSYVLGGEAIACGYGRGSSGLAMGGLTTSENQNHGLESEVGLELCWGVGPVKDANSTVNGYAILEAAWNPDGLPTLT